MEGGNSAFSNAGLFPSTTPKTAKITQTHSAIIAIFCFIGLTLCSSWNLANVIRCVIQLSFKFIISAPLSFFKP